MFFPKRFLNDVKLALVMRLDEIKAIGEPVEVLGIYQSIEGCLDISLCTGQVIRAPISRVVLGEEKGESICHIIGSERRIFELPVVKNQGYVTFSRYF